ncbi:hypothetical protein GQ44DRAFT_703715 [Phaeosphaeriaceae sp. PMI808]|nr:hypothetical protein GQ44DRAFT_716996 [Phaeosphaeriaceae sp. PMI808]KAH8727291.1 hypothetical protein GQ44DRAFT_703715 [Phaeosphaeriaceae sp. PMI808]
MLLVIVLDLALPRTSRILAIPLRSATFEPTIAINPMSLTLTPIVIIFFCSTGRNDLRIRLQIELVFEQQE